MTSLRSALDRTWRLHGRNPAIIDSEARFTWSEHMERVVRLAGVLRQLSIGAGDRFGIVCRNTWRQCELLHAGYWCGAVPVPVNYRLAPPEVRFILEDADVKSLFVEDGFSSLLQADGFDAWRENSLPVRGGDGEASSTQLDRMIDAAEPHEGHDSDENDDAILLYTGGTTGRSKGVPISHRNAVANGFQCAVAMKMRSTDTYLHVAPMFHSADLLGTGYTLMGACHAYLPMFTPQNLLQAVQDYGVTSVMLAPTMIILTLQDPALSDYDLGSLDRVFYGSSPMAVEWTRRTMEAFPGANLQQGYGLTETSPILTTLDEEEHVEAVASESYDILKSVGRPVLGIDMRIRDADGNEVAIGEVGEVTVRGLNVTKGYLGRPEETARAYSGDWFHTGDVGKMDENGYLYLLDRKKDVIITGGENVYSSEVEAVLYQHEHILECAVVGVPDDTYGEALLAVIVLRPDTSLTEEEVVSYCRGRIGGFKIPRRAEFVDELPKSAMGKILKNELRRIYGEQGG